MEVRAAFLAIRYGQGDDDTLRRVFILALADRWRVPPWEIEAHPEWIDDAAVYTEARQKEQRMRPSSERV